MRISAACRVAVTAVIAATTLAACGGGDDDAGGGGGSGGASGAASAGDGKFQKVTLGSVSNLMHTAEYVAVEKGYYAQNGLDVKFKLYSSGSDLNKALAAGDIQFGTASPTSVPASRAAGLKTRLVGPAMNDATSATYAGPLGIVGRTDKGVKARDAASLKGKRIGVLTGSTTEEYLRLYLEKNGMKKGDVKLVNLEVPDHPVSLKQGDVDAVASWEPFVTQAVREQGGKAAVVSRGDPLLGYVIGVGATDKTITERPLLKKFVTALAQANQYLRDNPEEGAKVATGFIKGLNVKDASEAMKNHLRFDPRISSCTADAFDQAAKGLVEAGEIKTAPPRDEQISGDIVAEVEKEHPKWFSDLPPIPAKCK